MAENNRDEQKELQRRSNPQASSRFEVDLGSEIYFDPVVIPPQEPTLSQEELEDQQRPQPPNRFQQGIDQGRQLAKDKLRDLAEDKVKDAAKKATGKLAKKLAGSAAKKAAATAGAAVLEAAAPYLAAIVAAIGVIIAVVVVVALLIFAVGGGDASADGTSETQAFSVQSTVDISALKTTIAGGVDSAAKASAVLNEIARLRGLLAGNPQATAILDSIEAAAKAIVASPADRELIEAKSKIIKTKTEELSAILGATGNCDGATYCLNVPGVKQLSGGHCGTASMVMVLLYLTNGANGSSYYDRTGNQTSPHNPGACPMANTLETNAPANKKGWTRVNWAAGVTAVNSIGKDAVIEAMKRSLAGGDPVITFFDPGGIYKGQHIVVVVGYDQPSDTFYINDPFPGNFRPKVNTAGRKVGGSRLTSDYIKKHLGGDGSPYPVSVHIRKQYVQ